jgi:heptosyltransferase-2
LSRPDLSLLLADTLMDRDLFLSPHWNWLYGGARYVPSEPGERSPEKILVIQWPSALGDSAMTMKFFSALRGKHRESRISFLTGETGQRLHRMNPFVDSLIENPLDKYFEAVSKGKPFDVGSLVRETDDFLEALRGQAYDLLINLQILPMGAVLSKATEPRESIGMTLSPDGMPVIRGSVWAFYLFAVSAGFLRGYNGLHRSDIFRLMVDGEGQASPGYRFNLSKKSIDRVQAYFDSRSIGDGDLVVGMAPLSRWPSKIWPHFGLLADQLHDRHGARVILFGAGDEAGRIAGMVDGRAGPVSAAAGFSLEELLAAISGCDLFISNDTGPMHLACALGKRVLALFGPTDLVEAGPWTDEWLALQSLRCSRCRKPVCEKQAFCMEDISVEAVMACVEAMGSEKGQPGRPIHPGPARVVWPGLMPKDSPEEERISRAYLEFFRQPAWPAKPDREMEASLDPVLPENLGPLSEEVHAFAGLVQKGLGLVEGMNADGLRDVNQALIGYEGFLKVIEIFNSMKHVEKRQGVCRGEAMYRAYYKGMLRDVSLLLRHLG